MFFHQHFDFYGLEIQKIRSRLAILNLRTYDPNKIDLVVLPMSGLKTPKQEVPSTINWMNFYILEMLKRAGPNDTVIRPRMVFMDEIDQGKSWRKIWKPGAPKF